MKKKKVLILTDSKIGIIPVRGMIPNALFLLTGFLYQRLFDLVLIFSRKDTDVTVVSNRTFFVKNKRFKQIYYDEMFFKVDWLKVREVIYSFIKSDISGFFYKSIDITWVVKERLAIHLSIDIIPHLIFLTDLVKVTDFDEVKVVTPFSISEKIALYLARKNHIKTNLLANLLNIFNPVSDMFNSYLSNRFSEESLTKTAYLEEPSNLLKKLISSTKELIFLVVSRPVQLKSIVPVYQKVLESKTMLPVIVSNFPGTEDYIAGLTSEKLIVINLFDFMEKDEKVNLLSRESHEIQAWWEGKLRDREKSNTSLYDFLLEVNKYFLRDQAKFVLPLAVLSFDASEKLIEALRPQQIVFFAEKNVSERTLALVAKEKGIKRTLIFESINTDVPDITSFDIADRILVTGNYMKEKIMDHGIAKNKIFLVGDPRVENIKRLSKSRESKLRKKMKIPNSHKIILALSTYSTELIPEIEKQLYLRYVSNAVSKNKDATLVIKTHPNESLEILKSQIKNWGVRAILTEKYDNLYDLINLSDAVVFIWSMAGFEALMLDRPTITVNVFGKDYDRYIPYGNGGASFVAVTEAEIERFLSIILNRPGSKELDELGIKAKKFLKNFVDQTNKSSLDRIVKVLLS